MVAAAWWTYDELLDAKLASDGTPKLWPDDIKPLCRTKAIALEPGGHGQAGSVGPCT